MEKDSNTEQKIIVAARKVFLEKGLSGARMQQIADEAGINKALLHYYFRSKEKLFNRIFEEVAGRISAGLKLIFSEQMGVLDRLNRIVDVYIETLMDNRYLPLFVINEINSNPERLSGLFRQHVSGYLIQLMTQIEEESRAGIIRKFHPVHLFLNVLGMVIFPFAVYPVLTKVAGESDYILTSGFLEERKEAVQEFIRHAILPKT